MPSSAHFVTTADVKRVLVTVMPSYLRFMTADGGGGRSFSNSVRVGLTKAGSVAENCKGKEIYDKTR